MPRNRAAPAGSDPATEASRKARETVTESFAPGREARRFGLLAAEDGVRGAQRGTAELLYSKTIEDVYYQNVNYIESGNVSPIDGRPIYKRASTALSNAYLLTNTDEGDQLMESVQLAKDFGQHFDN